MAELKHQLRKHEFPLATKEALGHLEKFLNSKESGVNKIMQDIADEFIFYEVGRRGNRKKRLNYIQELQLLQILCQYFEFQTNETLRQGVFQTLFGLREDDKGRLNILYKLVSMAIGIKCTAVLHCAAIWMQEQGCGSSKVVELSKVIVQDYCSLMPGTVSILKDLNKIAPLFTAHFITAATAICRTPGENGKSIPPRSLLEVVKEWVVQDTDLCLTSAQHYYPLPMLDTRPFILTPIPGLIHWCVKAPLLCKRTKKMSKEACCDDSLQTLYSDLHLGVLQTMLRFRRTEFFGRFQLLSVGDFVSLIQDCTTLLSNQHLQLCDSDVQLLVERLCQSLQVALSTKCLIARLDQLQELSTHLPQNRLLELMMRQWQEMKV